MQKNKRKMYKHYKLVFCRLRWWTYSIGAYPHHIRIYQGFDSGICSSIDI